LSNKVQIACIFKGREIKNKFNHLVENNAFEIEIKAPFWTRRYVDGTFLSGVPVNGLKKNLGWW
jgi:hypothetical protein